MSKSKHGKPFKTYKESESELNNIRLKELNMTWKQMADAVGCYPIELTRLNSGEVSPLYERGRRAGQPKELVSILCLMLGRTIGEIFPRYVCDYKRENLDVLDIKDLIKDDVDVENIANREIQHKYFGVWSIVFKCLNDRDVFVIKKRFIEDNTLEQVGGFLGITRERVRAIEAAAIKKIQNNKTIEKLREIAYT